MNLYEIVFSATGRTQKVVDVISSVFTEEKEKINNGEMTQKEYMEWLNQL